MSSEESSQLRLLPTMLASAFAGGLARFPCHPIDTVKARMQVQTWGIDSVNSIAREQTIVYRNFLDGLRTTWRLEGIRGLYRGFGPTVLGSMPASCLYFTTYEFSKTRIAKAQGLTSDESLPFMVTFSSGIIAETVSCLLWVPIDVVKERMQIQNSPRNALSAELKTKFGDGFYSSGLDAFRSIKRTEGFVGFYRGYGATVMSFGPFSALYFMFYENFKSIGEPLLLGTERSKHKIVSELPFWAFMTCGALAGACASFFTNPLDLVKLRMQVQRQRQAAAAIKSTEGQYRNMFDGLTKLWRSEGVPGMFRGVGARVAFHAPATAINMALFEEIKKMTYTYF